MHRTSSPDQRSLAVKSSNMAREVYSTHASRSKSAILRRSKGADFHLPKRNNIKDVEPEYTLQEIVEAEGLHTSPQSAYVLDSNNRLVYCNPAWDDFAWANHGESAV